ncbi:aspartate/glutamate racemase family protein [Demequina salsinemoris]|uniref:aspartate/glutamate racemase family protein n=1 Tax=Demequina salsinemoris TaxID=577470 RepID=UPI0007819954|nr:aspartate/glutamate racemase family protein [Demequina salsinemoris]
MTDQHAPAGYIAPGQRLGRVRMPAGQNVAGYPVGILYIDQVHYPMMPGNVVNAWTYDFPVRMRAVGGLTSGQLFCADGSIVDDLIEGARALQREGVRAITGACGFFGNYQREVAAAVSIPVAMSSLIQVPWIRAVLPGRRIGVLTANGTAFSPALLEAVGVTDSSDLVVRGLGDAPEFSAILEDRGEFDDSVVQEEVLEAARALLQDAPDIGAILLECSDMPPYASAVQAATGLPVFDFITMIRWLRFATQQMPYHGFI